MASQRTSGFTLSNPPGYIRGTLRKAKEASKVARHFTQPFPTPNSQPTRADLKDQKMKTQGSRL